MNIVVGGNNWLAHEVARWLFDRGDSVVALVPEGRDLSHSEEFWEAPFLPWAEQAARAADIPLFVGSINRFADSLRPLQPDVIVLCRSRAKVGKSILELTPRGVTNLHFGMLPAYGGCHTIQWAILNGEPTIGVTLHLMSEEFDEGPILAQSAVEITGQRRWLNLPNRSVPVQGLTAFEAYQLANQTGLTLFQESFPAFQTGELTGRIQDSDRRMYFRSDSIDFARDKVADLDRLSDEALARHVRAFTFPPLQLPVARIGDREQPLQLEPESRQR